MDKVQGYVVAHNFFGSWHPGGSPILKWSPESFSLILSDISSYGRELRQLRRRQSVSLWRTGPRRVALKFLKRSKGTPTYHNFGDPWHPWVSAIRRWSLEALYWYKLLALELKAQLSWMVGWRLWSTSTVLIMWGTDVFDTWKVCSCCLDTLEITSTASSSYSLLPGTIDFMQGTKVRQGIRSINTSRLYVV